MTTGTGTVKDHRLLDGRALRDRILGEVAERVRQAAHERVGRLVSVRIGEHKEVAVYVRGQGKAAQKVGLNFEDQVWPGTVTQEECKARLAAMNDDPDILGVILQRPLPAHLHGRSLASAIHPLKDVEGMNPASIGNIVYNDLALAPCTAAASVELIKATGLTLHGLEVVMVGHSEIVGKPQHDLIHHARPDGSPYPRHECPIYAALKDGVVHHVRHVCDLGARLDAQVEVPHQLRQRPGLRGGGLVGGGLWAQVDPRGDRAEDEADKEPDGEAGAGAHR